MFQENRGVRRAIREVHMKMIDPAAREEVRKIESVARSLLCLHAGAIFLLVPIDEIAWPFAANFRILLRDF